MTVQPEVSVIIVSWNVARLLRQCLASVGRARARCRLDVIVVDNASSDDSAAVVRQEFPWVTLIAAPTNLGFARAVNLALKRARGEFFFLLNPDARLMPETIPALRGYLLDHPAVGVVGPKILSPDGTIQQSIQRFPTFSDQALILLKLDHLWPNWPPLRRYHYTELARDQDQVVDQVKGAAFFFSRRLLEKIGLFDQGYFLWFEEVDYCSRAAEQGFATVYHPAAIVYHHGGQSFLKRTPLSRQRSFLVSLNRYFRLRRPWWEWILLQPFVVASYGLHVLARVTRAR